MVVSMQIKIIIFLVVISETSKLCWAESEPKKEKEELTAEETKKLEIIKRIKKINDDGSYTIGYEADDGSFKIESRDVLGQIKGTYGFVDEEGKIKRVSYSATNSSEILNRPEPPSVVQRIPTKKQVPTTFVFTSTQSTPTTKRVTNSFSIITTQKPNYKEIVNVSKATSKPTFLTYTSAVPKVLLQGKASAIVNNKFNEQISRPEVVTIKPRLTSFNTPNEKPVNEATEPENGSNILRRELPKRPEQNYNVREHIFNLQQSLGHDADDVYSSSMTTGTPRPLFTTTVRSIPLFSTVPSFSTSTSSTPRTTSPYPVNYLKNSLQDIESTSNGFTQDTTTNSPNPTPVLAPHFSSSRPNVQDPLVAVRHPHQRNPILVPLSQLRGKFTSVDQYRENNEESRQYSYVPEANRQHQMVVEIEQQPALVRRLPPHPLRPMPVQVDENGYIRELPRQVPTPYPVPIPATQIPKYLNVDNDVNNIQPPVSTKDFQRLLQELMLRQSRLEKINALTKHAPESYMQPEPARYRQVYARPVPYLLQRERTPIEHNPYNSRQEDQQHNYIQVEPQHLVPVRNQHPNIYEDYDTQSFRPNRRVARLLPSGPSNQDTEEYLPSDVREMLLLRMLQLAINPALPIDEDDVVVMKSMPVKRTPIRNVEILGEDESNEKRLS